MPTFRLEAAVIDNGRVLLVKRKDVPPGVVCPHWCLPGGEMAARETPLEALARLVKEQTGLDIRAGRLIGLYARPRWCAGGDTVCLFLGLTTGGSLKAGAKVSEARYFHPKALPANLFPWHGQRIADTLAAQQRAFVRSQDVAWPFPVEEPQQVLQWLMQQSGGDKEKAIREGLRLLGINVPQAEIVQAIASLSSPKEG